MKEACDVKNDIVCSVFSELKALGVKVPKVKKFKSGIPKQIREVSSLSGKIFGVPICEQETISVADYVLPKFIFTSLSYLKKYSAVETGLFRKAGSVTRQRDLRVKLERGESIEESEPNDVASLLKQWLRELPEPLIPIYLQDLFIRCQKLQVEENKISALLLCSHLLPAEHLHAFKYLLEFLSEMATNSDRNKMGAHNLALIMAPNIFVWGADLIDKSSNDLVQLHTSILELLINNVQRIVTSPCSSSHSLELKALSFNTDSDLSIDALDYSPSKSKRRRSGPVQDLFTGIRKLVSQNSASPNPSKKWNQDIQLVPEATPRSASKRKADPEQLSLSPLKKQATATNNLLQSVGSNSTSDNKCSQNMLRDVKEKTGSAHSRRKSFFLLRRKEKKKQKSSKPNEVLVSKDEQKVNTSTPSPFLEKITSAPSSLEEKLLTLQMPEENKASCIDQSSPLLSTSDIDRILSRPTYKNLVILEKENSNAPEKNFNLQSGSTDKRQLKRNVRNGSIVRGRPNTVRTGLPSDKCIKYNNESVSTDPKPQVSPTSPTETNVSVTLKTPNTTVSTPCVEVINSSVQTTVSLDIKNTKIVSKKKCRERIYSNSDSKVHKMKTRSAKVARIHSFPENSKNRPKVLRVQELRSVNISNHKKSEGKKNTPVQNEIEKENIFVPESPLRTCDDHVFKTPCGNFQTPETWFSGKEFFKAENTKEDDISNKRESIAMILKSKGHVQQKVHMYDHRSKSLSSTPLLNRSVKHGGSLYDPQYSNMQIKLSEKRSESIKNKKSGKNKHSPLPPPPKFVLPDSPLKPSYPLKELTNISGAENTTFSPSPSKTSSISTPNKESTEKIRKCTLKPKRNSYSGHRPYKLPKDRNNVLRSESSPLLQKPINKSSQKQLEFVKVSDQKSTLPLDRKSYVPVFKTKSSLSIDKLRLDQLRDEWHCEM